MRTPALGSALLGSASLFGAASAAVAHVARDGSSPSLTFDPNTTSYCSWWVDLTTSATCASVIADNFITLEQFQRWNPSLASSCGTLEAGHSYCVEASAEPPQTSTTKTTITSTKLTSTSTITTPPPASTTKPSNGITTPLPTQPSMVDNCDAFYFVKTGDSCDAIASANGITLAQFLAWNPSAGSGCAGLWASAYACVSIIGVDPSQTATATPTTTKPGNGITTPLPTQTGMVSNCNKFHFVETGQNCATIAALYSISTAQFTTWNPAAGSDCSGLWASTYACVGVIGQATTTAKPTSTSAGNGISTPTPTQSGMVGNCNKFHFVQTGQTCATIAALYSISTAQFTTWNPAVGSDCTGMWASTYACVGVIGQTTTTVKPTSTSTGNGIATPTPTQPGMVSYCKKFAFVGTGSTCESIANANKITVAQFVTWNTGVGGTSCGGLWANVYACVGI